MLTDGKYILDEAGNPVPETDLMSWAKWFEANNAQRRVARTKIKTGKTSVVVSTVFLGIDHNWWFDGPPILFETLVFGGPLDNEMIRTTNRQEALANHRKMVGLVKTKQLYNPS